MFMPTFDFKNSHQFQYKDSNYPKFYNPPNFYLPTRKEFTPPYTSPNTVHNILRDWLWVPLL